MSEKHALVFGASGLAGWAVVDQLLRDYPSAGTFKSVTALVNRPLSVKDSHWPIGDLKSELHLVSGVNLLEGTVQEFGEKLKSKVPGISHVTHVYYFAYKQESDPHVQTATNCDMLKRAVGALNDLCPSLKFIVFPSGTMGYGIYLPGGHFKAPLVETMDPMPEPYRSEGWYYAFKEILREGSKDRAWTWCEVRPDIIVGFAPNGSANSLAGHWATYLSLYALVEGRGAEVPFPGSEGAYTALSTDAASTTIARASIWASLHAEKTREQLYNIADEPKPLAMKERWPRLAAYFGLVGVGPAPEGSEVVRPAEYCRKHAHVLEEHGIKMEVSQGDGLDAFVGYHLDFNRQLDTGKIRAAGFDEKSDAVEGWLRAFDRFKAAGIIV
ncbi:hypothetical protein EXIGLDRAFT_675760 [Exidia glandulosa HHB12029]|uniref:PRISE-like Rossmann-fold domain-containing protein n=1 Tax=Exidia glandulosa HHB12029 TaxID=1314781 RepID=A0A165HC32_EXIGL|nr:hypothetical protein EXIGLDRAFT_675760 [Exidia glandulosa HHB12029]